MERYRKIRRHCDDVILHLCKSEMPRKMLRGIDRRMRNRELASLVRTLALYTRKMTTHTYIKHPIKAAFKSFPLAFHSISNVTYSYVTMPLHVQFLL